MPVPLDPALPVPGTPSARYGVLQNVYDVGGPVNVNRYSNLDRKSNTPDLGRIQAMMKMAADELDFYLGENGVTIPEAGSAGFSLLTQAWSWYTLWLLYQGRGDTQGDSDEFGRINSKSWMNNWRNLRRQYARGNRQDISQEIRIVPNTAQPATLIDANRNVIGPVWYLP